MIRSFTILAALAAIASPAAAATEMRVSIVGKDAATIQSDIRKAAATVCWKEFRAGETSFMTTLKACTDASYERAMKQVPLEARGS